MLTSIVVLTTVLAMVCTPGLIAASREDARRKAEGEA